MMSVGQVGYMLTTDERLRLLEAAVSVYWIW